MKIKEFVLYDTEDLIPQYHIFLSKDIEENDIKKAISSVKETKPAEWCYRDILEELCKLDEHIEIYNIPFARKIYI